MKTTTTRQDYLDRFDFADAAIDNENAVLSIGREFLPACALAVLDGAEGTAEYYDWLVQQVAVSL